MKLSRYLKLPADFLNKCEAGHFELVLLSDTLCSPERVRMAWEAQVAKNPDRTRKPADIKKQLEALAGREIDASAEQLIKLWYPAGSYSYGDGRVTFRNILFPAKSCNSATLLDASGSSSTGADGKRVFLLSDFVCFAIQNALDEPVNIIATPRSASPFFLTTAHALINNNSDLQITIFAWDAGGAAAPNVIFDWRCRVVSVPIVL